MTLKKLIAFVLGLGFLGLVGFAIAVITIQNGLPNILKVEDYKPLLVSEIYARGGEKIGEFYRENRITVPFEKIPKTFINAFLSAEDDTFYQHGGIDYTAILRATFANLRAGRAVQGASTITQQLAKTLLLKDPSKTMARKLKEALLSYKMEKNLTKEEILYLYLNQIYFGQGAHGIGAAADTYFRKTVDKLTIAEMALLAGLPQAPSRYSPAEHPFRAKERQRYVLGRMAVTGAITQQQEQQALNEPIKVYTRKEYKQVAPYFVETVRQLLVKELGEDQVLDAGLRIYTSVDYKAQIAAQDQVRTGLRALDKRQGFRGPSKNIADEAEVTKFLLESRKKLMDDFSPMITVEPNGKRADEPDRIVVYHQKKGNQVYNLPEYVSIGQIVDAVVTDINDKQGLVTVRFGEAQAMMDLKDMDWARKPDPTVAYDYSKPVARPSQALKKGDVISVKVLSQKFSSERLAKLEAATKKGKKPSLKTEEANYENFAKVALEQDPVAEASLLSIDQKTQEILAMVGGYDFKRNEFNRAIQAARQTGSAFKSIVYASALDKGYTPVTPIVDAPIVFEEKDETVEEGEEPETKKWKPNNSENKFSGDVLFRTALIRSLNVPTVKIQSDIGVDWSIDYARRLGIFSPLNRDVTLALGSSGVTLYEMTKVFSEFGRMGQRVRPVLIHKVVDHDGKQILGETSLDMRFKDEVNALDTEFEQKRQAALTEAAQPASAKPNEEATEAPNNFKKPNLYFSDPEQLISPTTSFLTTSLLQGVASEGTGARAATLGRPVAGKTGTSNGYFDAWFIGYTPQIATGVWVGFDDEKTLGPGEYGNRAALPIWLEYMKYVHTNLPVENFAVPAGIVFANIDPVTGNLASASSERVVQQAFLQGTEPQSSNDSSSKKEQTDFYKEDLSQ